MKSGLFGEYKNGFLSYNRYNIFKDFAKPSFGGMLLKISSTDDISLFWIPFNTSKNNFSFESKNV
ncbi:hypothetical protein REL27_016785 [Clostridioides difficile]|nr:hypothetical protein [Clostridioides difficile]MDS6167841.1 hypothetical protein [Clostridioides difficile]